MEVIQTTNPEPIDLSNTVILCSWDEHHKYIDIKYTRQLCACNLAEAIELAEAALENGFDVVMDDINKFYCANPCHMERNAMLKAFFTTIYRHNQKLFLRTDEISESLDLLIKKVFS